MTEKDPEAEKKLADAVHKASGMPRVDDSDDVVLPTEFSTEDLPDFVPEPPPASISPAQSAYERLVEFIRAFEADLNANEEVAMGFAGSDAGVVSIEGLGYHAPDIITFYGRDEEGVKTQLIQHVSQLSVILRAVPKIAPEIPARRIGFHLRPGWTGGEAGDGSA